MPSYYQPLPYEISKYEKLCGRPLGKVDRYGKPPHGETCGMPVDHNGNHCMSESARKAQVEHIRRRQAETYLDGSALANWLRYHGLS